MGYTLSVQTGYGVAPTKHKEPADMTWAEERAARYFAMSWRDRGKKL